MSFDSVKEMLEKREEDTLSEFAFLSKNTRGRDYPISEDTLRGEYQRDRDRILHSKAFRRLMHKTQVFLSPEADHYRTRLTHTLEVTQIARTIARALRLNEDLTEAIALGHDLGHTPFGHAGERVLRRCCDPEFAHYKQSVRVVEKLENLNLTWEVRDGIYYHTIGGASTLEGSLVKYADHIAYINHDIDDACRAGIITTEDIPQDLRMTLGETHGQRIETMVSAIVTASTGVNEIRMVPEIEEATGWLHDFLFDRVYKSPIAKGEEGKAEEMLEYLYRYYIADPEKMPPEYVAQLETDPPEQVVCDYISGMTDRYAVGLFKKTFIPEPWR